MEGIRYNGLVFDKEFLAAQNGDGTTLRFTRQERALLIAFNRQRGSLLSRSQLLDALAGSGTEMSERNVDFLVNRLRAKLGDSAREPRFIATQYGEGYVWIAQPENIQPLHALLVVGPAYGLNPSAGRESALLSALAAGLESRLAAGQTVVSRPQWQPGRNAVDQVRYSLDASFHEEGAALHAAFVLRHVPERQVLKAFRAEFTADAGQSELDRLADDIKAAVWHHLALAEAPAIAPDARPLEIRLHDAALLLTRSPESWLESEAQLARAAEIAPDDPALPIMRAMALFASLVLHLNHGQAMTRREWYRVEDEIEELVLGILPRIDDNPLLVLAAAKLLFFIDRGHFERAEEMAEEAFRRSTAFAAAFATLGQFRMCRGRFEEAVMLYDKSIEMSERGSEFHIYLLVLKCTALLAAADRAALNAACEALYTAKPVTRMQLGLLLTPPDAQLPQELSAMMEMFSEDFARRLIDCLYLLSGRHFLEPGHRANVMKGLTTHLARRFGDAVVPPAVLQGTATETAE